MELRTIIVKAIQAGDARFEAAPEVMQSFCVLPAKPSITYSGLSLSSSSAVGNQWYLNGQVFAGATTPTLLPAESGSYTVSVTGPCGGGITSDAFQVTITATQPALASEVVLYPNPTTDRVVAQLPVGMGAQKARLRDVNGQPVAWLPAAKDGRIVFSTRHLPKGIYLLEIPTSRGAIHKKLVVQ